jgi:uncharacterized protein (DUF433 family)
VDPLDQPVRIRDGQGRHERTAWQDNDAAASRGEAMPMPALRALHLAGSASTIPLRVARRHLTAPRGKPSGANLVRNAGVSYSECVDHRERITIEPAKRGGKPCIRGLRITVYDVLDHLACGTSESGILTDFPDLEREGIRAVPAFAADRERRLIADSAA